MSYSLPPLASFVGIVLLYIRLVMGIVLIYFGYPKIKDLRSNGATFAQMGFHPGIFWGTLIAVVEFVGGVSIILGAAAEIWSALVCIEMSGGTVWKVFRAKKGFPDYSYDLLMIGCALVILSLGAGSYALSS